MCHCPRLREKIVIRRIYESCKGEYAKIFEYEAEILRSNPGSTCAVCLDPDIAIQYSKGYMCVLMHAKGVSLLVVEELLV